MKLTRLFTRKDRALLGTSKITRDAQRQVDASSAGVGDTPTDSENATLGIGHSSAQQSADIDANSKLQRHRKKLTNAVGRYRRAAAASDQFRTGLPGKTLAALEHGHDIQEKAISAATTKASPAIIGSVALMAAEAVLLIAELAFYYQMFSKSLQDDASWVERAGVFVLAMLVPVTCLIVARLFAGSAHLAFSPQPDTTGSKPRPGEVVRRWLPLLLSTVALVGVSMVTWTLVQSRFHADEKATLGLVQSLPGQVVAAAFVLALLADAVARGFLRPPVWHPDHTRAHRIRRYRLRDVWLTRREVNALSAWTNAWTALQATIDTLLDQAEQAVFTAEYLVVRKRGGQDNVTGLQDRSSYTITPLRDTADPGTEVTHAATHLDLPQIRFALRNIHHALAHLEQMRSPNLDKVEQDSLLHELRARARKIDDYLDSKLPDPAEQAVVNDDRPEDLIRAV